MIDAASSRSSIDCDILADQLARAISGNPRCVGGLMANCRAFVTDVGPSGGPEALALLGADEALANRFWYGHVLRHPKRPEAFVALLSRSSRFINAISVPLLFSRYQYWTSSYPSFQPSAVRGETDAYAETATFELATSALAAMIARFDPVARGAREGSLFEHDEYEFRILEVYGQAAAAALPPIPAIRPLRVVGDSD